MTQITRGLLIHLSAAALGASIAIVSTTARADDRAIAGDIYVNLCVKCHGLSGKGDGPAGAVIQINPGDFTDCARMKQFSDEALFKVIKYGGPAAGLSEVMPRFGEGLRDEEISGLVRHLRAFCAK